jgi:hypothetical protein
MMGGALIVDDDDRPPLLSQPPPSLPTRTPQLYDDPSGLGKSSGGWWMGPRDGRCWGAVCQGHGRGGAAPIPPGGPHKDYKVDNEQRDGPLSLSCVYRPA